ncbi:hypothetical protein K438DRAFT_1853657 [Mycena galopus ATCC 62051]|nr:hypothetical protein K438DRAFT_1853657 [Mycena galopus ATCC 62051]
MSDDNGSDDDGSDDDGSDDDGSDDDGSDDGSDDNGSDDNGSDGNGSDDDGSDDDSSESSINARLSDITRRMSLIHSRRTTNTDSNSGADTPSLLSARSSSTSDNDSSQWSIGMSETNGLPNITPAVLIVDPDEGSVDMSGDDMSGDDTSADDVDWERLIVALARYHALQQEAAVSLVETATSWPDTPSSLRDVQAPTSRQEMQAFLQQSLQNYPR